MCISFEEQGVGRQWESVTFLRMRYLLWRAGSGETVGKCDVFEDEISPLKSREWGDSGKVWRFWGWDISFEEQGVGRQWESVTFLRMRYLPWRAGSGETVGKCDVFEDEISPLKSREWGDSGKVWRYGGLDIKLVFLSNCFVGATCSRAFTIGISLRDSLVNQFLARWICCSVFNFSF
jgi:hypothetical protein